MSETNIPITEDRRAALRQYKAAEGLTYDEAIEQLLSEAGWYDD